MSKLSYFILKHFLIENLLNRYLALSKDFTEENAYVVKTPFTTHGSLYTRSRAIYCNDHAQIMARLEKICMLSNGLNVTDGDSYHMNFFYYESIEDIILV